MINPHKSRVQNQPYGSATLFQNKRTAAGSTNTSDWVDIQNDRVKTFGFRGNQRGSWFIDVSFSGTQKPYTLAQGTFPAGPGSIKAAAFEESYAYARGRIAMSQIGSVSMWYGGRVA